jgi:hypothetical protein
VSSDNTSDSQFAFTKAGMTQSSYGPHRSFSDESLRDELKASDQRLFSFNSFLNR